MLKTRTTRDLAIQATFVCVVLAVVYLIAMTTTQNLATRGIPLGLGFLSRPAGFQITETVINYDPGRSFLYAMAVGLTNTLFLAFVVIVLSTIAGFLVGIGRLSTNPLLAGLCRTWVEITRNTPAVVILLFTYALWWQLLPPVQEAVTLAPGVHLSQRGLVLPAVHLGLAPMVVVLWSGLTLTALVTANRLAHRRLRLGKHPLPLRSTALITASMALILIVAANGGASVEIPIFDRFNFRGGASLTPELTTILVGLSLYTAGFVAEIVRAGVLGVRKGQWEAGRALGLTEGDVLRYVVVPLAMRIIVPPLTSQYITVLKNSTLAIVVGYPDFMFIMATVIDKTSHSIEGVVLMMGAYLVVSLAISGLLNWWNRRVALVER